MSLPAPALQRVREREQLKNISLSASWTAGDHNGTELPRNVSNLSGPFAGSTVDDTYHQLLSSYRKFKGGAIAASVAGGEEHEELDSYQDPYKFEFFYPTPSIFRWRHTNSYWTAITFILGSLLFTFNAAVGVRAPPWSAETLSTMESWPNFIGGCFFCIGCHASYLQLINVPTDESSHTVLWCADWKAVREVVHPVSIAGTLSYYLGAVLFQLGCVLPILPGIKASNDVKQVVIGIPNVVGSILFVLGAVCELKHNHCFQAGGATCRDVVWWAANLNFWGSVLFLLGSIPGMCMRNWEGFPGGERGFELWVDGTFTVGSLIFVVSSVLLILMWQSNDFGLTLLTQLNKAIQAGAHVAVVPPSSPESGEEGAALALRVEVAEEAHGAGLVETTQHKKKFSWRGVFFILVYCWLTFVAIVDVMCEQLWFEFSYRKHFMRETTMVMMQVVICMAIFMVLALQSVVPNIPREQPYRTAVILCRFLGFTGAVLQTMTFIDFCSNPFDKPPVAPTRAPDMMG